VSLLCWTYTTRSAATAHPGAGRFDMIRPVDPFNDLDVRKRCHLLLTCAKRYGAIRHFRHPTGAHIVWEGRRASLTVELAVSALKERGLLMRDGASALVLTRAGADLLNLWNEQLFGVAEPVTNEAALAQQAGRRS
jgi:hypothetical protein